jgi:SNF2 family DNA or RNA helicase
MEGSLTVNCYPEVAAHHAAFGLIEGRGGAIEREVSVEFRLLSSIQDDPVLGRFQLHSCSDLPETNIPLKSPHELYERQKKAVTKMLSVENGKNRFDEIEMSEEAMPGSTGWSLIAKASRNTSLRGGVIADAIGAGKTVISIALMLQGLEAARRARSSPRKSSATLVVVPPSLIKQWSDEIKKFTSAMPNVICVYDANALQKYTVKDFIESDVVICPVDLLEAKKGQYMRCLAQAATGSSKEMEAPSLPSETGQIEKNGASGVWIPRKFVRFQ